MTLERDIVAAPGVGFAVSYHILRRAEQQTNNIGILVLAWKNEHRVIPWSAVVLVRTPDYLRALRHELDRAWCRTFRDRGQVTGGRRDGYFFRRHDFDDER